jgi:hypothetical protein
MDHTVRSTSPDGLSRYEEEIRLLQRRKTVIDRLIRCLETYHKLRPLPKNHVSRGRAVSRKPPAGSDTDSDVRRMAS